MSRRSKKQKRNKSDDYLLLPSVTHPQGRAQAFSDAFKAMVRFMIEVNKNPTVAYAIAKTDRIVTSENRHLMSQDDLAEWEDACDEFEAMSEQEQKAWIETVLASYPKVDELPDLPVLLPVPEGRFPYPEYAHEPVACH